MKILVYIVLTIGGIFCELPPPYFTRNFKASPQLSPPQRSYGVPIKLQTKYGPPASDAEPLAPSFEDNSTPIKITLLGDYRTIPDSVWFGGSPQKAPRAPQTSPQTVYGPPRKSPQTAFGAPQKASPAPQKSPQTTFGAPQVVYGAPQKVPQTVYGVPKLRDDYLDAATLEEIRELKLLIEKIEQKGVEQTRNSKGYLSRQYLPVKEAENFKKFSFDTTRSNPEGNFNGNTNIQKIPSTTDNYRPPVVNNRPTNTWNNLDLPGNDFSDVVPSKNTPDIRTSQFDDGNPSVPSGTYDAPGNRPTTWNAGFSGAGSPTSPADVDVQKVEVTQFGPRNENRNVGTTTFRPPTDGDANGDDNNRYIPPAVESPTIGNGVVANPTYPPETSSVAVSNAVADQQFFLLQPDGTYQRIFLQKKGSDSEKENNQYGWNVGSDPNVVYAPLIRLN